MGSRLYARIQYLCGAVIQRKDALRKAEKMLSKEMVEAYGSKIKNAKTLAELDTYANELGIIPEDIYCRQSLFEAIEKRYNTLTEQN